MSFEVIQGETFEFDYSLLNAGDTDASQDITLKIGGTEEDRDSGVSVSKNGDHVSGTLAWDTSGGTGSPADTGSHTATVASADDSDSATIDVVAAGDYDVTITSTNSPVTEGSSLDVDVDVTNNGESDDAQDVTLSVDGAQRDSQTVFLDSGETKSITLSWATESGDAGDYTATVESQDDTATASVTVNSAVEGVTIGYDSSGIRVHDTANINTFTSAFGGAQFFVRYDTDRSHIIAHYFDGSDNVLERYDADTYTLTNSTTVPFKSIDVSLTEDGRLVMGDGTTLYVYDEETLTENINVTVPGTIESIAAHSGVDRVAVGYDGFSLNQTDIFKLSDFTKTGDFSHFGSAGSSMFSGDGGNYAHGGGKKLYVYQTGSWGSKDRLLSDDNGYDNYNSLYYDSDNSRLLTTAGDLLHVRDTTNWTAEFYQEEYTTNSDAFRDILGLGNGDIIAGDSGNHVYRIDSQYSIQQDITPDTDVGLNTIDK
jgi:hypothetical protein